MSVKPLYFRLDKVNAVNKFVPMNSRQVAFKEIEKSLNGHVREARPNALLAGGDSLQLLKLLPSESVSLVLTDPPYHATKKKNIYGDTSFKEDACYLEWMGQYVHEWKRILKPNGTLFCFCDSSMSARLEVRVNEQFNVLSHIVWTKPNEPGFDGWKGKMKKEALRQWYPHSERVIFAEPASEGNLHRSHFGLYLKDVRTKCELSTYDVTEMIGAYGKVNHGGAVSNWEAGRNTPSREQYDKLQSALISTGKISEMLPYEDVIRVFSVDKNKEFTDVWNFPSVRQYSGKHPAEKPLDLLCHAIESTTYKGDIVVDCFAGSGSTAIAAMMTGRKSLSMEIEEKWIEVIASRLRVAVDVSRYASIANLDHVDSSQSFVTTHGSGGY